MQLEPEQLQISPMPPKNIMVVEITDSIEKQAIARKVLEVLTDWFVF